jgi:hypothetical protein
MSEERPKQTSTLSMGEATGGSDRLRGIFGWSSMEFKVDDIHDIEAPADLVWQVLTDFPRYGEWNPFCVECRSTLNPGDPIDMKVKLRSRPQAQREWVTENGPGMRFAYGIKPFPMGALHSNRVQEITSLGATRSRYSSQFRLWGWMLPLVRSIFGNGMRKGFEGMGSAFKVRAEQLWAERQQKAAR